MTDIVLGLLAFFGAYLGIKSIKRQLIDNYIETRVKKALEINDKVLSKIRTTLSDIEQFYLDNIVLNEDDINDVIDKCKEISDLSEDGGKEVSTVAYLLYHTVKDLNPVYESKTKNGNSTEHINTNKLIVLVDRSLRLMIEYCNTSTPIPFKARLIKRSSIKRGLRKYLSDTGHYSLKHQPFGLTLNANSEVILRYSSVTGSVNTSIFRRKLFMFLQSNLPIIYELIVAKIYMPIVLSQDDGIDFFGKEELHLIKVQSMKRIGAEKSDYYDFYYANINPRLIFLDNYKYENIIDRFLIDSFTNKPFSLKGYDKISRLTNETIKISVDAEVARNNFNNNKWKIRYNLFKRRFRH